MTNATDSDLQQIKDLIAAGQLATQQQITDLTLEMRLGFAAADKKMEVGFTKLEGKIDTINAELTIIKSNQKAQDTRFWSLVFLIITTSIGAIGKLAKFY